MQDSRAQPHCMVRRLRTTWRRAAVTATALTAELVLRLWHASWRKDIQQVGVLDELLAGPRPVLVVFWHGKYFPLFALLEGRRAMIIVGDSFRGDVIARLSRRFGYEAALFPARQDIRSLSDLEVALRAAKIIGVAVDGPLGPSQIVKPGLLRLASDLGLLVVPVSVAAAPKGVQKARWDKRELPYPFARIVLSVGEPLAIPSRVPQNDVALWADSLRDALRAADEEAERRLRTPSY